MIARNRSIGFAAAALWSLAAAAPMHAQDTWNWRKSLAAGRTLEIKGVNGEISATAASGNEVEVVARKQARKSDPSSVSIKVVEHADGVTICALYPTPAGKPANECKPGSHGRMNTDRNDTNVHFEVRVPRGVHFVGRTVNGGVQASGLTGDAEGRTVNGSVKLTTTQLARASTVNGSVNVRMGRADWSDDLEFSTVNGSVLVEMPAALDAEVSVSTVNGSLSSDWPMTIQGKWGPRHMKGKIGRGGRDLEITTVNGNVELRKAN